MRKKRRRWGSCVAPQVPEESKLPVPAMCQPGHVLWATTKTRKGFETQLFRIDAHLRESKNSTQLCSSQTSAVTLSALIRLFLSFEVIPNDSRSLPRTRASCAFVCIKRFPTTQSEDVSNVTPQKLGARRHRLLSRQDLGTPPQVILKTKNFPHTIHKVSA